MNSQQLPQSISNFSNLIVGVDRDKRSGLSDRQQLNQSETSNSNLDTLLEPNQDNAELFPLIGSQPLSQSSRLYSEVNLLVEVGQDNAQVYTLAESVQLNSISGSATTTDSFLTADQDDANSAGSIESAPSSKATDIDPVLGVREDAALLSASVAPPQAASSATSDVGYTFTYYYGNGDYYKGYGYVDASVGYYAGLYFYPYYDETYPKSGKAGYYYIDSVNNMGVDYGYQNQVVVTQYYDSETESNASYLYSPTIGWNYGYGSAGLGSEVGYAYNFSLNNSESLFGNHYYEADLTTRNV